LVQQHKNQKVLALTSYYDELRSSLVNEVGLSEAFDPQSPPAQIPKTLQWKAIWDTGATNSAITKEVVDALGLSPIGPVEVKGVHGKKLVDTYLVNASSQ